MKQSTTDTPTRKITANLPADLLDEAMKASGLGLTETLRAALEEQRRIRAQRAVTKLRGKVKFSVTHAQLKEERE